MASAVSVAKEKLEIPPLEIHKLGDRVLRQSTKRIAKIDDSVEAVDS